MKDKTNTKAGDQSGARYHIFSLKHGPCGNDAQWWRPEAKGYTSRLEDAGVYSAEAAFNHVNGSSGPENVAVLVEVARELSHTACDFVRLMNRLEEMGSKVGRVGNTALPEQVGAGAGDPFKVWMEELRALDPMYVGGPDNEACWRDFFDEGYTPQGALHEDMSNG